jgi:hypothetical protein
MNFNWSTSGDVVELTVRIGDSRFNFWKGEQTQDGIRLACGYSQEVSGQSQKDIEDILKKIYSPVG